VAAFFEQSERAAQRIRRRFALVFSLGATVLPSRQGARLDPAEGLRYE